MVTSLIEHTARMSQKSPHWSQKSNPFVIGEEQNINPSESSSRGEGDNFNEDQNKQLGKVQYSGGRRSSESSEPLKQSGSSHWSTNPNPFDKGEVQVFDPLAIASKPKSNENELSSRKREQSFEEMDWSSSCTISTTPNRVERPAPSHLNTGAADMGGSEGSRHFNSQSTTLPRGSTFTYRNYSGTSQDLNSGTIFTPLYSQIAASGAGGLNYYQQYRHQTAVSLTPNFRNPSNLYPSLHHSQGASGSIIPGNMNPSSLSRSQHSGSQSNESIDSDNVPKTKGHNRKPQVHPDNSDSEEDDGHKHSVAHSSKANPARQSSFRTSRGKIQALRAFHELGSLGDFVKLNSTDEMYKIISEYVKNSLSMVSAKGNVIEINKFEVAISPTERLKIWKQSPPGILLWCKTTPGTVKSFAANKDGCVAFYDRLGRALPVKPEDLKSPIRQIVLLCLVYLGNTHIHKKGYQHWASRSLPHGYNSVKGCGQLIPDPDHVKKCSSITVPSGNTVCNKAYPSYELDYNEFLVFNHTQFTVKYAVDVEVHPGGSKSK